MHFSKLKHRFGHSVNYASPEKYTPTDLYAYFISSNSSSLLCLTIKRRPKKIILYRKPSPISDIESHCVIYLNSLKKHQYKVTSHVALCSKARCSVRNGGNPILMLSEGKTLGLACVLHSTAPRLLPKLVRILTSNGS